MSEKVLIVEDQFIEANDLKIMLERSGYAVCGIARSVTQALEIAAAESPTLVLVDIFLKGPQTGIDLAKKLRETNTAFIYISANSNHEVLEAAKATQPYGFLVKPFRKKDLLVTLEIARYRHENSQENEVRKAGHFREKLEAILNEKVSVEDKMLHINMALQAFIPFDFAGSGYITQGPVPYNALNFLRLGFEDYQVIGINELQEMTNLKMNELKALQQTTPVDLAARFYSGDEFEAVTAQPSMKKLYADTFRLRSNFVMPVHLFNGEVFFFFFYSRRPDAYNPEHLAIAHRLHNYLADALQRLLSVDKIEMPLSTKTTEKVYEPGPDGRNATFEGIIGNSHMLLNVFDHIMQVAPVNTSVLILGESGTGKERIADCIHRLSPRKEKPLIKINCAALPVNLIESELFGHEKGSFTGATEKRIGKFELADGGTLFLDEIGELPLELQAKLLRVLQEKEIERIGGREAIKIDVRIIAATNRNLEKEVGEGRFRLDLYYRLNIFPIQLPSLRERIDDIPLLIDHFISSFNKKTGKKIAGTSNEVLQRMLQYSWPGNIRELENIIERSVLLTRGDMITDVAIQATETPAITKQTPANDYSPVKSIEENERDHIISVLQRCKGKIWGEGGAAEMLNIPPTTLNSKMKKLGIKREYI